MWMCVVIWKSPGSRLQLQMNHFFLYMHCCSLKGTTCLLVKGTTCLLVKGTMCFLVRGTMCLLVKGTMCFLVKGTMCLLVKGTMCFLVLPLSEWGTHSVNHLLSGSPLNSQN